MLLSKLFNKLKKFEKRKPIHLCWWFQKQGLPIPKYFIGGASYSYQAHYKIGDDDSADPDTCSFDALNTERTGQAKLSNFMVRIQVTNTIAALANQNWHLYYNTVDNVATATQVTTTSTVVKLSNGTPTDQDPTTGQKTVFFQTFPPWTWVNGIYIDTSDFTNKLGLAASEHTDFQFCCQFDNTAGDNTTHYFYLTKAGTLNEYTNVAKVKTAVVGWTGEIDAITDPDEIDGLAVANIEEVDTI